MDEDCRGEYLQWEAGWVLGLTPVDSSFLIQHIITLQTLLPQDAVDANAMNKFKKPLEEIRDSRSFKGC